MPNVNISLINIQLQKLIEVIKNHDKKIDYIVLDVKLSYEAFIFSKLLNIPVIPIWIEKFNDSYKITQINYLKSNKKDMGRTIVLIYDTVYSDKIERLNEYCSCVFAKTYLSTLFPATIGSDKRKVESNIRGENLVLNYNVEKVVIL